MAANLTKKVVFGATAALLGYEAWTLINKDQGDTISETIWESAKNRPLIPFAFGFLMGHFFWQKVGKPAEVKELKGRLSVANEKIGALSEAVSGQVSLA